MPWQERTTMSLREEFVLMAQQENANIRALCRSFQISPKTGYKWLARRAELGPAGLADRGRRPQHSPGRTAPTIEDAVVAARQAHPAWGGRKLRQVLLTQQLADVPSASTVTAILRRHGLLDPAATPAHRPTQRFERPTPNALWQMDFKGHFALQRGRCHPLTVLDDHSRFNLGLAACANEQAQTVQDRLQAIFTQYGLPEAILSDNGSPWSSGDPAHPHTRLTVWLLRLGIQVLHGRPYHPQTQGKEERFHRTLTAEVLQRQVLLDLAHCQRVFDAWRVEYNCYRPHEALGLAVPASRYQPSPRLWPSALPPVEYWPGDQVRKVQQGGVLHFQGRVYTVGKAFIGQPVALRPTSTDGVWTVHFCQQQITTLDERDPNGP